MRRGGALQFAEEWYGSKRSALMSALAVGAKLDKRLIDDASADGSLDAEDDESHMSALQMAVSLRMDAWVVELLRAGAKWDMQTSRYSSAVHMASYMGHVQSLQILLDDPRADLNLLDNAGRTGLHVASASGKFHALLLLLRRVHRSFVDSVDQFGFTPLAWAVERDHRDCAEALLDHGARMSACNAIVSSWFVVTVARRQNCKLAAGALFSILRHRMHVHSGASALGGRVPFDICNLLTRMVRQSRASPLWGDLSSFI